MPRLRRAVAAIVVFAVLVSFVPAASAQTTETWNNVYDVRNRLVEVRRGTDILLRMEYDAQSRLIKKVGEEGVRQYVYDGTNLLAEYDGDGNELVRYDWAPEPGGRDRLLRFSRSSVPGHPSFYPVYDGNGSVTGITDGAGQLVVGYHLDAWGSFRFPGEINASANRFAYTAYRFMPETGLYFAVSRFYDPKLGRFLTRDSYLGDITDVPTLHRYTYARNNPTGYIDPDGHESYRQWIGLDKPTASVELEFLKHFGYNAWNAVSFGALNRQDTLVERSEAGLINEDQYQRGSAINAAGTMVVAGATIYGAGAAGQLVGGSLMMAGAASGASGGFISSSGSAVLDVMTGTRRASEITAAEIAVPTILGGVAGGVFGAGYAAGVRPFEGGPVAPAPPNPAKPVVVVEGQSSTVTTQSGTSPPAGYVDGPPRVSLRPIPPPPSGAPARPAWQASEANASADLAEFGFRRQPSYLAGEEVPYGTRDSVRPDLASVPMRLSVDVKNYNVTTPQGRYRLVKDIVGQVGDRAANLPQGMRQGIILDIRGQSVSQGLIDRVIARIVSQSNGVIQAENIYVQR